MMEMIEKPSSRRLRSRTRDFEHLRQELLRTRSILLNQGFTVARQPLDQALPADPFDVATGVQDDAFGQVLADRAHAKLKQIERALQRMRDSSYGTCVDCQIDIPIHRLRAQPDTIYCVECKAQNESVATLRTGRTSWMHR